MIQNIYSLVREINTNYENDDIDAVEGLSFNMYDTIREIEFLTSGHYLSGDFDENGDLIMQFAVKQVKDGELVDLEASE